MFAVWYAKHLPVALVFKRLCGVASPDLQSASSSHIICAVLTRVFVAKVCLWFSRARTALSSPNLLAPCRSRLPSPTLMDGTTTWTDPFLVFVHLSWIGACFCHLSKPISIPYRASLSVLASCRNCLTAVAIMAILQKSPTFSLSPKHHHLISRFVV